MNNLDKFRYSYDDPSQLNISLKKDPYEKVNDLKSNNLNQLLSTSVKVTKENTVIVDGQGTKNSIESRCNNIKSMI